MVNSKDYVSHNDVIAQFTELVFNDVLVEENVVSKKKAIMVDLDGDGRQKYYGYFLEKGINNYFIDASLIEKLPIVVTNKKEVDYKGDVFYKVISAQTKKIPREKTKEFREIVDLLGSFPHTNELDWLLYKLICVTAYCSRINYRVVTPLGFGKDCIVNNIKDLPGDTANIYGATFAKLEYSLRYKNLVFNELGNLKAEDKYNMQQFLLAAGAFFNSYTKRSRKTDDTQEQYDISKTSIGILYNPPDYYIERGQEYFDIMFTRAVNSRFMPFYLDGKIKVPQLSDNSYEIAQDNFELYKDIISTLNYFKDNDAHFELKFKFPEDITFGDNEERYERTIKTIAKYVSEYAADENEFDHLIRALYQKYIDYVNIINTLNGEQE